MAKARPRSCLWPHRCGKKLAAVPDARAPGKFKFRGAVRSRRISETFMRSEAVSRCDRGSAGLVLLLFVLLTFPFSTVSAGDEPDLIFRRSTVFKLMSPNDKLATYGVDDPEVDGVACHFTVPEKGGFKGWLGLAEEVSDISLACRQIGPIRFKKKFAQARTCSASAARCSSRRCRSCAAATRGA